MITTDRLPTIDAPRVRLRWLEERDVDALFTIFSHPQVVRYWAGPALADRAAASRLLDEIHDHFRRKELFQWGVARRSDDLVIGTCTLLRLDAANRRAEVGYALGHEHWGKGYIGEALEVLLDFAFGDLGLHRIEADIDPRNTGSIRTVERLGFQQEGLLRERWLVNGETQDSLMFGLLRPEWRGGAAERGRRVDRAGAGG